MKIMPSARAEQVWEAFKCELTSPPTDDLREALVTAIRTVADRLCTDVGELHDHIDIIREIADELGELE